MWQHFDYKVKPNKIDLKFNAVMRNKSVIIQHVKFTHIPESINEVNKLDKRYLKYLINTN